MPTLPSTCPLDCPDRCSLDVAVEGGRITKIGGSHRNPLTQGYICGKVARFDRRVYGPERLLAPAVRVGPKGPGARFERVSWDEAMDLIVGRWRQILAESGPEALLPYWYGGSNGYLTGGGLDSRLWARLGTTRIARTLCAANTGAAVKMVYGGLPSNNPTDLAEAKAVVLWGVNAHVSGIHLVPHVKAALQAGGRLLVVDPRKTPFTEAATVHLPVQPGTDVAVALALANVAFARGYADRAFLSQWADDAAAFEAYVHEWTPDRAASLSGVPASDIERFAEVYAEGDPAFLRCGWGLERNRNGTDAVRSVLSLPAVFGKFKKGGGYAMSTSSGYLPRPASSEGEGRRVNMSALGKVLLEQSDPPIRALWIYDCNPVATVPDQTAVVRGLARDDLFTVVHEQVWNDTTDYADVVLPATTFLEHHELSRSYGGYLLQWSPAVIDPVGESRPNHAVFRELAQRLGLTDEALDVSEAEIARGVVEGLGASPPGAWDTLTRTFAVPIPAPTQFVDAFPERPIRLMGSPPPRYRPPPVDADRPFTLISPASSRGVSSTLFETAGPGTATVSMCPEDAAALGLSEGDLVALENGVGQARAILKLDSTLRPGVASWPKGTWRRATHDGWTGNALVPDVVDEHGGGACYNDARVSIRRVLS